MPNEEWVILLRNLGLILHQYQYLVDIEDTRDHLCRHQWKVYIVTVSHNIINWHIDIQIILKALI